MKSMLRLAAAVATAAGALGVIAYGQAIPNIRETNYCPNYPSGRPPLTAPANATGELRKIVINAPGAVCNDGTPAVMYVRAARPGAVEPDGPAANRWVIHFEGGGSCETFEDCGVRWCGLGYYTAEKMSTSPAREVASPGGLFGRNTVNRLGDRNLVLLNYCSSDEWQGRKSGATLRSETDPERAYSVHFQGATIVSAAFDALERGVAGMPNLTNATDVLISGDSGGAKGARAHLDRLAARLKAGNPAVRVRGMFEAALHPDFNGRQGFPAGDPRDPVYAKYAEKHKAYVALANPQLDDSCLAAHAGDSAFLCRDPGYFPANHITTPFFQIQDVADPNQLEGVEEAGGVPAVYSQLIHDQVLAVGDARNRAVEKAAMTATPGAVARQCGIHVTWSDNDGFLGKRIRSGPGAPAYSFYELLWNWMTGATPSSLTVPRPPATPENPAVDPICEAKAVIGPAGPAIATASSASYAFQGPVAPESIVATFGPNLAAATVVASTAPWPTTLGGVTINITDARGVSRAAPIYFVSENQVMYLVPAGTAAGTAQVSIGPQRTTLEVAAVAPGLYTANQKGSGVAAGTYLRITAQGERSEGLLFDPATQADTGVPAGATDQLYLILYGTGMRGGRATATVGGVPVPVAGPVAQGQYQGLDQINLGPLPVRIGRGQKQIVIRQGEALANLVTVTFRTP